MAARLKDAIAAAGYRVWWQEDIQCGREWHGDIDDALARAACVVVLWSKASLSSPWVRHEASQAIARGIYAPVRIEAVEIDSPYDRIQATDLLHWNGDAGHAGFQNLVRRIEELLPAPVSATTRVGRFLWRHALTLLFAAFATVAAVLLVQLGRDLQGQIATQAAIATEIQRTLQPIEDLQVSAFVELGPDLPGLQGYVEALRERLLEQQDGRWVVRRELPEGIGWSRRNSAGEVEVLSIRPQSTAWPRAGQHEWLHHVVDFMELSLAFRRPGSADEDPERADLSFKIGSYDPDGSERSRPNISSLEWELSSNAVSLVFTDTPAKEFWTSNGRIVSVPDLEQADLSVAFTSVVNPSLEDAAVQEAVLAARRSLRLGTLFLSYSGRRLMVRGAEMAQGEDAWQSLRRYTISLASPAVQR